MMQVIFRGSNFPGVAPIPGVIFYRTRHTGLPRFSVTINSVTVTAYALTENDPPERCWHEIIPASVGGEATLKAQNNELLFGVTSDDGTGSVIFGDVVIFYTSNETTIAIPLRSIGEPW